VCFIKFHRDGDELIQTIKNQEQQDATRTEFSLLVKDSITKNQLSALDRALLDTMEQT